MIIQKSDFFTLKTVNIMSNPENPEVIDNTPEEKNNNNNNPQGSNSDQQKEENLVIAQVKSELSALKDSIQQK